MATTASHNEARDSYCTLTRDDINNVRLTSRSYLINEISQTLLRLLCTSAGSQGSDLIHPYLNSSPGLIVQHSCFTLMSRRGGLWPTPCRCHGNGNKCLWGAHEMCRKLMFNVHASRYIACIFIPHFFIHYYNELVSGYI